MKVLIVDDSPEALALARKRLEPEGVELQCADSGKAGLAAAASGGPDLILLDVDMPDLSGFDVCRALKADPDLCMVPVIFLSGSGNAGDKIRGLDLGAVDYVTKPFDAFELRARVRAALRTKHLQDLLAEYARIDPLTGLSNRRALTERLQQEWTRIQRRGGTLALVMADIDHFKRINDTHGHMVGDEMLCEVARAVSTQCRQADLPVRCGGEEFAIVVPDESAAGALGLAERCRQAVASIALRAKAATVRATASFGVADTVGVTSTAALVQHADEALYRAKNAGRNQVSAADSPLCSANGTTDEEGSVSRRASVDEPS
jgi:two-component system cell cycle response regulator